ncbi:MAG TPA: WbqC family protein [Allosphingosinicella sp.]|jgi:hypothetical protein
MSHEDAWTPDRILAILATTKDPFNAGSPKPSEGFQSAAMVGDHSKTLFLMQPYFLPWISYFARIACSDVIVFVDNRLYKKDYFLNRARFLDRGGDMFWVTVPVSQHYGAKTCDIVLDPNAASHAANILRGNIPRKHLVSPLLAEVTQALQQEHMKLVDLNIKLLRIVMENLALPCPRIELSSRLSSAHDRTEFVCQIAESVGATAVITGWGAGLHIHDLNMMRDRGIQFLVQSRSKTEEVLQSWPLELSTVELVRQVGVDRCRSMIDRLASRAFLYGAAEELTANQAAS